VSSWGSIERVGAERAERLVAFLRWSEQASVLSLKETERVFSRSLLAIPDLIERALVQLWRLVEWVS
jgi:hypothetical protein